MDWNQIEINWTAMTRRIRADAQCGKQKDNLLPADCAKKGDVAKTAAFESVALTTRITLTRKAEIAR